MSADAEVWDVVVVGAGPAGATAAAFLSEQGHRVLVTDRDDFPRFHIGESLLPAATAVLNELGVEATEDTFLFKRGAQFLDEPGERVAVFDFSEALPGPPRSAWQVDRARFDQRVRDVAKARGAHVEHGISVSQVDFDRDGVSLSTNQGLLRSRYLIDASGQGRLMARLQKAITPFQNFGKAASFVHYSGLSNAALDELGPGNDIRIIIVPNGWMWAIPLPGRRLSVGLVSRNSGQKKQDVLSYVDASPLLSRLTVGADRSTPDLIGSFSYRNEKSHGCRFVCLGDAACFIDPVFSSGVSLAMMGAHTVAKEVGAALNTGQEGDPELLAEHEAEMDRCYRVFGNLVYRFYNTQFVDQILFPAPQNGDLRPCITSVFAGDVRPENKFVQLLLNSRLSKRGLA